MTSNAYCASSDVTPPSLLWAADCGVGYVWFVEPLEQLVKVLELDGPTYRIIDSAEGDAAVRLKPFDAIEFPLAMLWQR